MIQFFGMKLAISLEHEKHKTSFRTYGWKNSVEYDNGWIMSQEEKFDGLYKEAKERLKSFGDKPIKDVGQILTIIQEAEVPERKVMEMTQEIYIKLFQETGRGNLNQARQSWVVASGNNFEEFVRNLVNDALNGEGIIAIKGDQLKKSLKARDIVQFLTLKANRRCTQKTTGVWPDSDIVVLTKDTNGKFKVFALLNCKTSDHSRNDAVLFWALALRDNNIKYCLMTQDLDKRFIKGDGQASGLRKKSEAYLDRIFTTHPLTEECSQVKKIDFTKSRGTEPLFEDLRVWRKEVVPNFEAESIGKEDLFS